MSGFRIDAIQSIYRSYFPSDWIDKIDLDTEGSLLGYFKRLDSFENEVLLRVAYSMLSGEYVFRNDLINRIETIQDELKRDFPVIEDASSPIAILIAKSQKLLEYTDFTLDRYKNLIVSINNQYTPYSSNYVLNAYSFKGKQELDSRWHYLFDILFDVVEFDHRLDHNEGVLKRMLLNLTVLEDLSRDSSLPTNLDKMVMALKEKCLFLLKKLLIYDDAGVDYLIDFAPRHIDVDDASQLWMQELNSRFEFYRSNNASESAKGRNLEKDSFLKKLHLCDYPLLMKYYYDSPTTQLVQVANTVKEFEEKCQHLSEHYTGNLYNSYSIRNLRNYMYNALLRFKIKTDGYSINQLMIDMDEIESLQYETMIKDYYPYMISSEFICNYLNTNNDLSYANRQVYLQLLDQYIDKFSLALEGCKQRCFTPIQAPYLDCICQCPDFGPVFIPSSYCRPLRYKKYNDFLSKLKVEAISLKSQSMLEEERKEIESIKNEIDRSRRRDYEIIAIYTGIITFLFGTIDFFSRGQDTSFINLIYNVLSLGLILLLFVSGISVLTLKREKNLKDYFKNPRFVLSLLMSLLYFGLLVYLIHFINPTFIAAVG